MIADAETRMRSDLSQSTAMFGRLADPQGENNAISQVLYGLALRSVSISFLHQTYPL